MPHSDQLNAFQRTVTALLPLFRRACLPSLAVCSAAFASNHREAPITALDRAADITDLYAFVSYDTAQTPGETPEKVTFILCVDPLQEPANGPNWAPFDPDITYRINVDNDNDAREDLVFEFKFETSYRLPGVYTTLAGFGPSGAADPETGDIVVPPQITGFANPGVAARQSYTVSIRELNRFQRRLPPRFNPRTDTRVENTGGGPFYAVPTNAGPRTMDYDALFNAATYTSTTVSGVSVFAGTVDDPFFIDLGAAFDTGNFRTLDSGVPGVLTPEEDGAAMNFASDAVSGYAVNAIAIEAPIEMLTSTGQVEAADSPNATIGVWGTTSRPRVTIRRSPNPARSSIFERQVQRIGNPLINELIIGTGSKDRFSMDEPSNDEQFASFFLDPVIAQVVEALYNELLPGALDVPEADRTDLLPLVQYLPPIAADGAETGPIADLLRLNTGVPATPPADMSGLGLIGGDAAGYPNGRRLSDDVVDITLRVGVGGILIPEYNRFPNNVLGDGVNVNDKPFRTEFPYLANSPDGRNRRHLDPGEDFPDGRPIPVD